MQQLSHARAVLLDEQRRFRYDRQLDAHRMPAPVVPPPDPPPDPAPHPPPVPRRRSSATREFPYSPTADYVVPVAVICVVVYLIVVTVVGAPDLPAFPLVLVWLALGLAKLLQKKGSRVLLSPDGVTLYGEGGQHIPWAMVSAIEATEVDGVARVGVRTVDNGHTLLPAPRGRRLLSGDFHFTTKLEEMQRWHSSYRTLPGGPRSDR